LLEADGRFPIEAVREQIGRRLHRLPRFRQFLYTPRRGLGWPLWVDARPSTSPITSGWSRATSPPARAQLLVGCGELRRRRLDRSRPLWEMWFLPGLTDARAVLFIKVHHAVADGVAGVAAFGLCQRRRACSGPATMDTSPGPPGRQLFDDNMRRRIQGWVSGLPFEADA